jgi:hypothetical protein
MRQTDSGVNVLAGGRSQSGGIEIALKKKGRRLTVLEAVETAVGGGSGRWSSGANAYHPMGAKWAK